MAAVAEVWWCVQAEPWRRVTGLAIREYGSGDAVTRMKTTIDIPDALALEAKGVAARSGATLRELVVAGLRAEVDRRGAAVEVDFHFPTMDGQGLVAALAPEDVVDRSYGFPS
ncbi:DUF2191 domain-containing protein [Serinicoccus profundi]|uniref:DUF2191 domain-containing protein n=1 Tax=Serinicoccus profundi TaxID=1078471 RepID=UPI000255E439|nr:DUF2191 domain-containing protein [Serinicoccus profundi]